MRVHQVIFLFVTNYVTGVMNYMKIHITFTFCDMASAAMWLYRLYLQL